MKIASYFTLLFPVVALWNNVLLAQNGGGLSNVQNSPIPKEIAKNPYINFVDGSVFWGEIRNLDKDGMEVESPIFKLPVKIQRSALNQIFRKSEPIKLKSNCEIETTNGNVVRGDVVSINEKEVGLKMFWGQECKISRAMISKFSLADSGNSNIYEGPIPSDPWEEKGKGGRYYPSKLTREGLPIPQSSSVRLKLEDADAIQLSMNFSYTDALKFTIGFWSNFFDDELGSKVDSDVSFRYSSWGRIQPNANLVEQNRYDAFLRYTDPTGKVVNLGQKMNRGLMMNRFDEAPKISTKKPEVWMDIFADKRTQQFHVYMNGLLMLSSTRNKSEQLQKLGGDYITFENASMNNLVLKYVRVSKWDGKPHGKYLPDRNPNIEMVAPSEEKGVDQILLTNGDLVKGQISEVMENIMILNHKKYKVNIPFARMSALRLSGEKNANPRRRANDVKLALADNSQMTLEIEEIKDGKVKGKSEIFGDLEIPLKYVYQLDFNLYRKK